MDDEIVVGPGFLEDDTFSLDDTQPMDTVEWERSITVQEHLQLLKTIRIKLYRGNVFHELNDAFRNGTVTVNDRLLEIEMIQPNGLTEKGEDNSGVFYAMH